MKQKWKNSNYYKETGVKCLNYFFYTYEIMDAKSGYLYKKLRQFYLASFSGQQKHIINLE